MPAGKNKRRSKSRPASRPAAGRSRSPYGPSSHLARQRANRPSLGVAARCDQVGWVAVLIAFGLVPLVFVNGGDYNSSLPKLTLLWWCLLVAVVGLAASRWLAPSPSPRRTWPRLRLALPVAALTLLTVLSTILSVSPTRSLLGINGRYGGLIPMLTMIGVGAVIVAYCWARPGRLWQLAVAGTASGVVGALAVLGQRAGMHIGPSGQVPSSLGGLLGNSDFAGAHLAMMIPLALVLRDRVPAKWSAAVWASVGLLGLGVLVSHSRGAAIAAVAAVATLGWFARDSMRRPVTIACTVLAALALGVVLAGTVARVAGRSLPGKGLTFLDSTTLQTRVDYWIGGAGLVGSRPLLGTGPDTFALGYPAHAPADANRLQSTTAVDSQGRDVTSSEVILASSPHDIYVERAIGSGLLGLVAYLGLVVLALLSAWRARARLDGPDAMLLAGFSAVFVGYLVQGITSIDVVPLALIGWMSLAALAALADPGAVAARDGTAADTGAAGPTHRRSTGGRFIALVVVVVVALAGLVVSVRPVLADHDLADATGQLRSSSGWPTFESAADHAIALDPFETDLRERAARIAIEVGAAGGAQGRAALDWAGAQARRGLQLAPGDTDLLSTLGVVYRLEGVAGRTDAFALGDAVYRRWAQVDPYGPDQGLGWSQLLAAWAMSGKDHAIRARAVGEALKAQGRLRVWSVGWYDIAKVWQSLGNAARARAAVERALQLQPDFSQATTLRRQLDSHK